MADTLTVVMGVSPHPHDRKNFDVRWETYLRKVAGGAFGRERTELKEVLQGVARKTS